jgi:hypothetical protein
MGTECRSPTPEIAICDRHAGAYGAKRAFQEYASRDRDILRSTREPSTNRYRCGDSTAVMQPRTRGVGRDARRLSSEGWLPLAGGDHPGRGGLLTGCWSALSIAHVWEYRLEKCGGRRRTAAPQGGRLCARVGGGPAHRRHSGLGNKHRHLNHRNASSRSATCRGFPGMSSHTQPGSASTPSGWRSSSRMAG